MIFTQRTLSADTECTEFYSPGSRPIRVVSVISVSALRGLRDKIVV